MAYLERIKGLPPATYSPELIEIDKESGPWLERTQANSLIVKRNLPRWDLDLDEGVIWFGDDEHNEIVTAIQAIGTYSASDRQWIWAWTSPQLNRYAAAAKQVRDAHPEVGEFTDELITAEPAGAWTLAAAMAHCMKAQECYRLPTGEVDLYVALFEITEIGPDDPRYQKPKQDPDKARQALTEYAGQMALHVGAVLLETVKNNEGLDPVIEVIYRFCEKLEALPKSPVGKDTPAGAEATELAQRLRQAALSLSVPPGHPALADAAKALLGLLEEVAKKYEAWPQA